MLFFYIRNLNGKTFHVLRFHPYLQYKDKMQTSYQYRLRLTPQQQVTIDEWLELLPRQYNYRLAERFNWWEQNRCDINACSLICHLPELKDRPDFYSQKRDLLNTKAVFSEYKAIHCQVLQNCVERVQKAFDRSRQRDGVLWIKGDCNGSRPRFRGVGQYRSFTFPQMKQGCIQGKFINLPKIGIAKLILHRPIPDGFRIKTATLAKKADGYYITLSLQDSSVPKLRPELPTLENTIGIDMGLQSFLVTDEGEPIEILRHYRKAQKKLKRLQRSLSRKKKGSNPREKALKRVAKAHLKVVNQRKDCHYKTAKKLLSQGKILGMKRSISRVLLEAN